MKEAHVRQALKRPDGCKSSFTATQFMHGTWLVSVLGQAPMAVLAAMLAAFRLGYNTRKCEMDETISTSMKPSGEEATK